MTYPTRSYVTVDVRTPATPNHSFGIKEDLKYVGNSGSTTQNPDYQRWKLSVTGAHVPNQPPAFTVSNAAFPGKVLQPAGRSLNSGTAVVLGDPAGPRLLDALKTV